MRLLDTEKMLNLHQFFAAVQNDESPAQFRLHFSNDIFDINVMLQLQRLGGVNGNEVVSSSYCSESMAGVVKESVHPGDGQHLVEHFQRLHDLNVAEVDERDDFEMELLQNM